MFFSVRITEWNAPELFRELQAGCVVLCCPQGLIYRRSVKKLKDFQPWQFSAADSNSQPLSRSYL